MKAVYKDMGAQGIPSLTGKKEVVLRPLKIEAEDCDAFEEVSKERPSSTNYMRVAPLKQEAYIVFRNMDLKDIKGYTARVSSVTKGGVLEIRAGSPDGVLLSELMVPSTGNDLVWKEVQGTIQNVPDGKSNIYMVFKHKDESLKERMFFLDWLEFKL